MPRHIPRDIRTDCINFRKLLERAQYRIVQERSALHDDLRAHLMRIADLDNLEERILDDRNSQPGSDIAHRCAFLLRLLHTRIHEHRTTAS